MPGAGVGLVWTGGTGAPDHTWQKAAKTSDAMVRRYGTAAAWSCAARGGTADGAAFRIFSGAAAGFDGITGAGVAGCARVIEVT